MKETGQKSFIINNVIIKKYKAVWRELWVRFPIGEIIYFNYSPNIPKIYGEIGTVVSYH